MLTLNHFLYSVPTCQLPISRHQLLTLFQSSQHDIVVLVNDTHFPLGIISSRSLVLSLLHHPLATSFNVAEDSWHDASWDWQTCLSPLILVPSHLSLIDFFPYLQEREALPNPSPTYGLIDGSGKFLGLLNSWQILQTLLAEDIPTARQPLSSPTSQQLLQELLDEFPLPIMLQTGQGEILQQNRLWHEQIGEFVPADEASACPLPTEAMLPSGILTQDNFSFAAHLSCSQWLKSIPQRSHQLGLTASGDPWYPQVPLDIESNRPINERIWQFIKCPLITRHLSSTVAIIVATDVTEHQQLCQELAAKNADLVQLNRLKDEFLACISHELKSPLTAVVGLSSLLQDQKVGTLNDRQVHYAELIYQSGRQLMTLVNDLLDLTRLETGQLKLTLTSLNIKNICEQAYHGIQKKYQGKPNSPLSFTLKIEPGLEKLVADELRLHQMLVHLLDNAAKFTQAGGKFGLKVNRWEDWIAFTVWDTGIGIPEEFQHLIFQKFQQLEDPLTRQFEGTGLGLVLTQRLARAHGGEVSFISKTGQGSQFTLLLPPSPHPSSPLTASRKAESLNPLVLIVEAIPYSIENLRDKLMQLGYQVVIARTGTEAVEKARQLRPYAIFLNPLLPLLSGWDVLTLLKSDPQTQKIPVFITATQKNHPSREHHQADGFLSVPADVVALEKVLSDEQPPSTVPCQSLTILRLNPNAPNQGKGQNSQLSSRLEYAFIAQFSQFNHRILEADDLDQGEMLTNVWQVDVVILDGHFLEDPASYLRSLSQCSELATLPLVILDLKTTQAANQLKNLSVFPCLISEDEQQAQQLLQVVQIAAESNFGHKQ